MPSASKSPTSWSAGSGPAASAASCSWPRPDAVDLVEVGDDEVVLGREVLVEGRLGHAGLGDDQVDADRPDAAGVEEPEGGVEDAVARRAMGVMRLMSRQICLLASTPR